MLLYRELNYRTHHFTPTENIQMKIIINWDKYVLTCYVSHFRLIKSQKTCRYVISRESVRLLPEQNISYVVTIESCDNLFTIVRVHNQIRYRDIKYTNMIKIESVSLIFMHRETFYYHKNSQLFVSWFYFRFVDFSQTSISVDFWIVFHLTRFTLHLFHHFSLICIYIEFLK